MERIKYQDLPAGMFEKLMEIEQYINTSTLEIHLLELIRLRVALLNGCAYCIDMHHKELESLGETSVRLSLLTAWQETNLFTNKEKTVFRLTDAVTRMRREPIKDEVVDPLLEYFTKSEVAMMTLAIGQINTWTRLMKTFQFTPGRYKVQEREEV